MGLYVNRDSKGWTELRVHGVSGTPPESSLEHPRVTAVAGDTKAGFYRRAWESRSTSQDTAGFRREAYSWGGLTSGDGQRALWLLLLPFMLLNMAFFADHGHTASRPHGQVVFRTAVQRLLALSLTATYVLGAVSVSLDLVGWQCGNAALREGATRCAGNAGWLRWLQYDWLSTPGRHLTAAAVVPVALVALLWYLGNKTWQVAEAQPVEQSVTAPQVETPLEDRRMWNGRGPVRRLRALHIAGAFALTGVFLLAPLLERPHRGLDALADSGNWQWGTAFFRSLLLVLALAVLAFVVVTVGRPETARRTRPSRQDRTPLERDLYQFLPWGALALVVGAGVVASRDSRDHVPTATSGQLPWEVAWIHGLFIAQAVMLVLLLISLLWSRLLLKRRSRDPAPASPGRPSALSTNLPREAWGGLVLPGVAFLGWALAGALAAGFMLRVAEILGAPAVAQRATGEQVQLTVPDAYFWSGTAAAFLIVVAIVIGLVSWITHRGSRQDFAAQVGKVYGSVDGDSRRRHQIAKSWARAQLLEGASQKALGIFLMVAAAVTVAGAILFARDRRLVTEERWLVLLSNLVLSAGVLVLLWAGRQAYRSPGFRRTVGILWDIGTFWPRETHPLAPPCYAERTVPDLLKRVEYLTGGQDASGQEGHVILSCHSQGSVIGAALILQSRATADARIRLLTYGSPLTRLFVRFFPAYFNARSLQRIGTLLAGDPACGPERWPWRNLYRPTDPIGSWVFDKDPLPRAGDGVSPHLPAIDRQLLDPRHFARQPGDPCYPAGLGHSNYFADPTFEETVEAFRKRAIP
ncbi:hypothetical protein AMK26_18235 [Streptomyces sp. CB03234]|uniref:hypothetical protein n=1 Tax=Streptomyces sp. (strain CB03234) TaxID=1703937 RepID=UPI000939067E|nr:hypothetical protein [Streptomyces sp. CB03234]OKK03444.1 hypothetical protein AMK26_18235 [Streptomyces sp. CB03234]